MKPRLTCFSFAWRAVLSMEFNRSDPRRRFSTATSYAEYECRGNLRTSDFLPPVAWKAEETAIIVCDVWDYHHSINAVRRLTEMLPRMNALLTAAREHGSIIIHAPSDCMPAYETHAARMRVSQIPISKLPENIASWCSRIPAEENQFNGYPIDQSDGGEDDDPQENRTWSHQLESLGRNPNMPWKAQSPAIDIDAEQDYISDRGDEVWSILQHRKIQHVLMVGGYTNMCVLGRPFGLRQMVQQKMDVALVRDLTDCMYNPQRWPYVDHFTGNDLVISYVERCVCPTITSDQILGGAPLRFKGDQRQNRDIIAVMATRPREWEIQRLASESTVITPSKFVEQARNTVGLRRAPFPHWLARPTRDPECACPCKRCLAKRQATG